MYLNRKYSFVTQIRCDNFFKVICVLGVTKFCNFWFCAVTLSTNRSKKDKDIAEWLPTKNVCVYVMNWIGIKARYSLTYDDKEATAAQGFFKTCKFGAMKVTVLPGFTYD